ncbi:universal stress protein [uncultured Bradyrhizobium sp.]|jgi:nucleotide-binding universal stress UspA family protein|uniref:universal stress protein n=1 Tax=unclassified Sphingomonas TaxID=196159 RepID=UPI00261A9AF6|nr:universal stress protein [uncultured Bradyrhizobium sp.]
MKLLAVIVGAESAAACLDAATLAARALGDASVEALNVVVDPEHIIAASEEIDFQRLREHDEGTAQQRADAAQAAFVAWNAGASDDTTKVDWRSIVGTEEEVVAQQAVHADALIIIGRERTMDSGDALHAALFATGKPVLIVPAQWRTGPRTGFAHMVVCLSDSDAARHAITGAEPWLRAAERVTALRIGEQSDPAVSLEAMLEEIGIHPELHVVPRTHDNLGAQLVAEARALGADLLVTGAYRHNEMVEWLLGGTTRHLLAAADLPLLMAH